MAKKVTTKKRSAKVARPERSRATRPSAARGSEAPAHPRAAPASEPPSYRFLTTDAEAPARGKHDVPVANPSELPLAPNCVTIFGAGIAGLTAAHELVERGFQVQVWEKAVDERYPDRGCDVGGLARTQWSAVDWPETRDVSRFEQDSFVRTRPLTYIPERFYLRFFPGHFETEAPCRGDPATAWTFEKCLAVLLDQRPTAATACTVTVRAKGGLELTADERKRRAFVCRDRVKEAFAATYPTVATTDFSPDSSALPMSDVDANRTQYSWLEFCCDLLGVGPKLHVEVVLGGSDDPDFASIELDWLDDETSRKVLGTTRLRRYWWPEKLDSVSHDPKNDLLQALGRLSGCKEKMTVYVEASAGQISRLSATERDRRTALVERLFIALYAGVSTTNHPLSPAVLFRVIAIDRLPYKAYDDVPEDIEVVIGFRPRERWLPGEHGYRFFPSFYHHIFDTMQRTPLLDLVDKPEFAQAQERAIGIANPEPREYAETGGVVMDNIHPTSSTFLAFAGGQRPSVVSRTSVRSFEELRVYFEVLFGAREEGGFGFTPRDTTRITLKLLKFATACDERRRQYEELSWWDYLEADTFSPEAQETTERIPQALVAMSAKESDARSQWIPVSQILLDEVRADTYRDGTLRGPTTEAWLIPWRRYLEAQGVEFVRGELEGFDLVTQPRGGRKVRVPWPRVNCSDLRYPSEPEEAEDEHGNKVEKRRPFLRPGYFILAISADKMRSIAHEYAALGKSLTRDEQGEFYVSGSDLQRCRRIGSPKSDDELKSALEHPRPEHSDFRHFAGIQYYFAEDVFWVDGHVYYPDAPWRLSSISQARFWQEKMDWEHGYRGVLSVIIGAWDEPGTDTGGKTAWECDEEELAREVWRQIKDAIVEQRKQKQDGPGRFARRTPFQTIPEPIFWHIDDGLRAKAKDAKGKVTGYENDTPFLVNGPGQFEGRPGNLDPDQGYSVEHGLVVAGYYTKTFTRIPSMEAANESARHAVNAILRHLDDHDASADSEDPEDLDESTGRGESEAPAAADRKKLPLGVKVRRTFCDVWSPEDREIDDLKFLKELDAKLVARGLPHLLDIFDVDYLAQHLLSGGSRDPLDPLRLLSRLRRLYRDVAE